MIMSMEEKKHFLEKDGVLGVDWKFIYICLDGMTIVASFV